MKNSLLFLLIMMLAVSLSVFGQAKQEADYSTVHKNSQSDLFNEVQAGYGAGSLLYFTGRMSHSGDFPSEMSYYNNYSLSSTFTTPKSAGTFYVGYKRTLNHVVSMGFYFGFQQFTYTQTATEIGYEYPYTNYGETYVFPVKDILLSGIPFVTFCYLDKPKIKMYSGIGMGIMVDFGSATMDGKEYTERKLWPAGQLTFMGLRFGRALGGFLEFGFGTLGLVNAGLSYKFSDE